MAPKRVILVATALALADIASAAPSISKQPQSQAALYNQASLISIAASGAGQLSYQWYQGLSGDVSTPLPGATGTTLSLSPTTVNRYWVRVSDSGGSTNSTAALVLPWATLASPDGSAEFDSASYANGQFFITGNGYIAGTADGVNWTVGGHGSGSLWRSNVVFGNATYVLGGGSTTQSIYISPDAVTWTFSRINASAFTVVNRSLYTGRNFVAAGTNLCTSPDGVTWTTQLIGPSIEDFATGGGQFVGVGLNTTVASSDGTTWVSTAQTTNLDFKTVAYGHGRFVSLVMDTQPGPVFSIELWTSTNGSIWTQGQLPTLQDGTSLPVANNVEVVYGAGIFVAIVGPNVLMSDDGVTWSLTQNFLQKPAIWQGALAYGSGRFLTVGPQGTILQSLVDPDAVSISSVSPSSFVLSGQAPTLAVAASGPGLTYQWYRGTSGDIANPVNGATTSSFVIPPISQNTAYWVLVKNGADSAASTTITLTVAVAPAIATQPMDADIVAGPGSLAVVATGIPAPSLQWYQGATGVISLPVQGATSATLESAALSATTRYWVRATNMAGSADSTAATLTPWTQDIPPPILENAYSFGSVFAGTDAVGNVYTSTDGLSWNEVAEPGIDSIVWIGTYVGTGGGGIFTSPDLVTWTLRHNIVPAGHYSSESSICWHRSKYVVVGYGYSSVSSDGVNWTDTALPATVRLDSVLSDFFQLVAAGQTGPFPQTGVVYTSVDGVTWTLQATAVGPPGTLTDLHDIALVNNRVYMATGSELLTSTDGDNWTQVSLDISFPQRPATGFINGLYIVGLNSSGSYYTSPDAVTWTPHTAPADVASTLVLLDTGRTLLAFGSGINGAFDGGFIYSTTDALTWTFERGAPAAGIRSIAYGGGHYVAVGFAGQDYTSDDGKAWQRIVPAIGGQQASSVAYGLGTFVCDDFDHLGGLWTSTDSVNWTFLTVPGVSSVFGTVGFAGNLLFAFNAQSIAESADGSTWAVVANPPNMNLAEVAYGSGTYVGVGHGMATSPDGVTWTSVASQSAVFFDGVAFGKGLFVAIGSNNTSVILTSPDAVTWTPQTVPNSFVALYSVAYSGGRFVIATSGGVMSSRDGVTWEFSAAVAPGTTLAAAPNTMFGVAFNGLIWTSAPASTAGSRSDFNGDGFSDLLWRNSATGVAGIYLMNGTSFGSWVSLGVIPTAWQIVGTGDFNGDGRTDIVWQNTSNGDSGIYLMNGSTFVEWFDFNTSGTPWRIAGTGDFNGDGKPDVIWRNTATGEAGVYLMNGTSRGAWMSFGVLPTVWQIVGTGDFDGDGNTDIVWQRTDTGDSGIYLMSGTNFGTWVDLRTGGQPWRIVGTGDFNADGNMDILWQNPGTGDCGVYLMNGTAIGTWQSLGPAGANWTIHD